MLTKAFRSSAFTKFGYWKKKRSQAIIFSAYPCYQFSLHNYMKTYDSSQISYHHGRSRIDENAKLYSDPKQLQQFINRQNALFSQFSKKWADRTQQYMDRVNERRDQRTQSTTQIYNGYEYYTTVAWHQGREYTQIWRRQTNKQKQQLVLDIMRYPLIKKYYKTVELTRTVFSPCSKYIAFGVDLHNNQQVSFMIKNIGKDHIVGVKNWEDNRIKGVDNLVFSGENGIFYTKTVNFRPAQLWYQDLKNGQSQLIYQQKNGEYYLDITMTKDNKHLIVNSNSKQNSKLWTINIDESRPESAPNKEIKKRFPLHQLKIQKNTKTFVSHNGSSFVVWRDSEKCSSISLLDEKNYKQQIIYSISPEKQESITDIDVFQGFIVLYIRKLVSPAVRILEINQNGDNKQTLGKVYDIQMPYQFGSVHPGANQMLKTDTFLFYINNIFVYDEGYQYNLITKKTTIKQQFKMTGPKFNTRDYIVDLHQVPTQDGQMVPLTTIVPKRNSRNRNKMLLHCYGHYGLAYQISFNNTYWAALQNGWSLAYAHVRGGGEKGTTWHKQAVKGNKFKNWTDLEDCVAFLFKNQYTHPNILILSSHSAGAITIWNSINRYPHIYKGVIMSYPFLDVLGSLLDSSKPLTQTDYAQFGNPNESLQTYNEIQALSPYENIEKNKSYPFIYLIAGTKDYRCPLDQVAKFVKRFRHIRTWSEKQRFNQIGKKGLLVKINDSSHEGIADLGEQLKDGCEVLACMDFLIQQASHDVTINKGQKSKQY